MLFDYLYNLKIIIDSELIFEDDWTQKIFIELRIMSKHLRLNYINRNEDCHS
jgi:hypothetical protein